MLTYLEVKTELQKSAWSSKQRDQLNLVLPRLGQNSLLFIRKKIFELGSEFSADRVIRTLNLGSEWIEAVKQGQTREMVMTLREARRNPQIGYGSYVLPAILDIRTNSALAAKITPEVSKAMVMVESRYFKDLPAQQVINSLQYRLLDLIQYCDIVGEVKRYCYYRSLEEADTVLTKKFQYALEQNQELVGTQQLTLNKKNVEPSVRNWLSDFITTSGSKGGFNSTYSLVQYFTLAPNIKLLSEHDQAVLAEFLKLYSWLVQPIIIESEIEHYEQELALRMERGEDSAPSVEQRAADLPAVPGLSRSAEQQRITEKIMAEQSGSPTGALSARANTPFLAKGISLNQQTNVKMPQEAERLQKQRDTAAVNIARKLEDLRKRKDRT